MKPPSVGLRLWVMIATGTVFILLALVELVLSTFSLYTTDKPFEEVTALLIFGFTVLWFSTSEQENARTLNVPHPPPPPTAHPANPAPEPETSPEEGDTSRPSYRV